MCVSIIYQSISPSPPSPFISFLPLSFPQSLPPSLSSTLPSFFLSLSSFLSSFYFSLFFPPSPLLSSSRSPFLPLFRSNIFFKKNHIYKNSLMVIPHFRDRKTKDFEQCSLFSHSAKCKAHEGRWERPECDSVTEATVGKYMHLQAPAPGPAACTVNKVLLKHSMSVHPILCSCSCSRE